MRHKCHYLNIVTWILNKCAVISIPDRLFYINQFSLVLIHDMIALGGCAVIIGLFFFGASPDDVSHGSSRIPAGSIASSMAMLAAMAAARISPLAGSPC